ncbi:phage tail spike protein, partial [Lapidilactobacillus bayanensis]|uniref:phage tail spike protein n=1 Tax=Lapidilactobacillus bayanensis TaxID=2485998 RepID=UPI000F77535D
DLINETVGAYTADKAYNVAYYIEKFTVDSGFEIGVNEISTLSRKLEWEGTDETALARILSVATQFDAELDFSFKIDGTNVVHRYINIYKKRGSDKQVRLYLNKDINNIVTTGNTYDLYTSVVASGGTPEGSDKPITLKGYKWTDPDGRYTLGTDGILRDTVAVRLWSRIKSNNNPNPEAHHLQRVKSYEATTQASLLQSALGGLKKAANPAVNYEIDIAVMPDNIAVGDTVHIVDDNEDLYLSARVLELKYDYALEQYTATLGDYLIEVSTVDERLKELADNLKEMPKSITYYPWVRYADDDQGNGFSTLPQGKAYMAVVFGKVSTPSDNVADYAGKWQKTLGNDGQDGTDGIEGPKGDDGQTTYFHKAYANSSDGKTGFSITDPSGKAYLGTYNDFTKADSTDPAKYLWQLVKGDKGDKGSDGLPGKDGVGIATTVVTYQASTSGTTVPSGTWSASVPTVTKGQYLWTRTIWTYTDKSSEVGYSVAYVAKDGNSGSDGLPGKDGTGIRSTVIEYAVSSSGVTKPTTGWSASIPDVAAGQFMWTRTTWSYTDGTNETGYSVAKAGKNGANGKDGADGKTPYFHQAWADSQDGKTNFSTTVSLGKKYLGTYTDFILAGSTDPTQYRWTELVGAMEVGGENLIRNGNFINQTSTHWRDWNGATGATREISKPGTDWPANTGGVIHLVNPNGGQWGYAQDDIKVAKGGTYTISAVVIGTQGTKVALQHGNGGTDAWQAKEIVKPTSGMDTLSYTFKVGNDAETTNIYVGFGPNGKGTVWMSRITLQKGNVATDWEPAPGDTDEKIDAIIPPPSSGINYPSNPKKGQQHWLTDANGKPKGLFQYDGSKWVAVPVNADAISANTLNGMTINGVTINGSTINSPNINVPFNNVTANPDEPADSPYAQLVSGTTKLTSNLEISANLTDGTNKTPQWVKTLVSPQGFSNIISTPDASKPLYQTDISFGSMFLSEWHSDVTANDGFVSSYLKAGDAATYERKDTINDTANFKGAVVRYSRKGMQVNVGFSFMLLSDTGWVGLSAIPKGYTPASLASVGITCPSLSYRGYSCVVYPNSDGWRLIPTTGQGNGTFQGTVSYVTYDDYPYNDAK